MNMTENPESPSPIEAGEKSKSPASSIQANSSRGSMLALAGGLLWGFSGTCGQYLTVNLGVDPAWITPIRLLASGLILTLAACLFQPKALLSLLRTPKDWGRLVAFAVFGLMGVQYSFLKSISLTNAATATVLQYLGPLFVMFLACASEKRWPLPKEALAIALALLGTFLLATRGNPAVMAISSEGLSWGLLSAVALMLYTVLPVKLMQRYGTLAVIGPAMLVAGFILSVVTRIWNQPVRLDWPLLAGMAGMIVLGTVLAFSLYLQGVIEAGPVKASMISSVEPLSALFFSVVWLGSRFALIDLLGFACITATVFLLVRRDARL